jgi:hypothetical protein
MAAELKEGLDYYIDELGRYVFTREYHLKRGFCCQNGCKHCPYKADGSIEDSAKGSLGNSGE